MIYSYYVIISFLFLFLVYSWLNHCKTMKKVRLMRQEMDRRHHERMRQYDEILRQLQGSVRRSTMVSYDEVRIKTDKLSPTKKMITHKMSMTKCQ